MYCIYERNKLHQNVFGKLKCDVQVDLSATNRAACQNFKDTGQTPNI